MSRIINLANPGKLRNQARRTIAEILRHLLLKRELDDETKDMAAAIVFALREIHKSVDTSATAWEKRNYYLKADRFRLDWEWAELAAQRLADIVQGDRWERLPEELGALAPRFADIRIARMTRDATAWRASYRLLLSEEAKTTA